MFIRNIVWTCGLAIVVTCTLVAQTLSPFDFLRSTESARAAALAGAFVAIGGDASAQLYNPATIPSVPPHTVSLTVIKHVLDINSGLAAYVGRVGSGWWGANVAFTSYGSFTRTDALGNVLGSFGASHVAFNLSYANALDTNAYYGVTLGYVQTTIDRRAAGALVASGGLFYQLPHIRTAVGIAVRYVGLNLATMNGEHASLPTDVRIGLSHRLRGLPLLVNVSLTRLAERGQSLGERLRNFAIGGELYIGKAVQIRLGYDNGIRATQSAETTSFLTGVGVGAGLVLSEITLDYTMTTLSAPALVHRLSCSVPLESLFDQ
jgi:hypothetical protein